MLGSFEPGIGWNPYKYKKSWLVSSNLERKHLNTFQRCEIGYNFKEYYKELAEQRRNSRLKQYQGNAYSDADTYHCNYKI
jgi:hypothetical protein